MASFVCECRFNEITLKKLKSLKSTTARDLGQLISHVIGRGVTLTRVFFGIAVCLEAAYLPFFTQELAETPGHLRSHGN